MSDTLTKDILHESFGAQAAKDAVAPAPAYCIDKVTLVPAYITYFYTQPADPRIPRPARTIPIVVSNGFTSTITHECFPARPGVPGVPGTNAVTSVNYQLGWTGGADSVDSLTGDGQFQFSIKANSIGVVCGLNDSSLTADYREIDFAIYGTHGQGQVLENGVAKTAPFSFVSTDIFTIRRLGSEIAYFKGSTLLYTSATRTDATLVADSSLYAGGDQIVDPAFSTAVDHGFGGTSGSMGGAGGGGGGTGIGTGSGPGSDGNGTPGDGVGGAVRSGADLGQLQTFGTTISGSHAFARATNVLRGIVTSGFSATHGTTGTGGGDPGTGVDGDWGGRGGNQLRGLVTQGFANFPTTAGGASALFTDTFTGSGAINAHTPDSGGATWVADPGSSGTNGTLSGGSLSEASGSTDGWHSTLDTPITDLNFTQSVSFTIGADGSGASYLDIYLTDSGFTHYVETYLHTTDGGTTWLLDPTTSTSSASVDVSSLITPGTHTITTTVTPSSVTFSIDGTPIPGATLTTDPSTVVDEVDLTLSQGATAPAIGVDSIGITGSGSSSVPSFVVGQGRLNDPFGTAPIFETDGWAHSDADGAPLTPQFVIGNGGLTGLATFGISRAGMACTIVSTLGHIHTAGGNTNGAHTREDGEPPDQVDENGDWNGRGGNQLRGLVTFGIERSAIVTSYLLADVPHRIIPFMYGYSPEITGEDGSITGYGITGTVPVPKFSGNGAGALIAKIPVPRFSGTASASDVGSIKQFIPVPKFSGTLKVTVVGGLNVVWKPKVTMQGFGGGVLKGTVPVAKFNGQAVSSRIGVLAGRIPRITFEGSGFTPSYGALIGKVPVPKMISGGVLIGTVPRITFVGSGSSPTTVEYEAYSLTLIPTQNGEEVAATRYTTFPFTRIVRFRETYYGVGADGLYALDGDDFDGTKIVGTIAFALSDYGTPRQKRGRALHLAGRIGGDMQVSATVSDDGEQRTYTYKPASQKAGVHNHRVLIGRGLCAAYWSFAISNTKGEDFALESASPEFDVQKRTVWD